MLFSKILTLPSPPPTMILFSICKTACPQLAWFPLCTDHTLEMREMYKNLLKN